VKRSYKLRSLGRAHVDAVIRSSPTLAAAAKKLGVDPSTIRRWRQAGEIEALREQARKPRWTYADYVRRRKLQGPREDPRLLFRREWLTGD
jgi:transposase-like protein